MGAWGVGYLDNDDAGDFMAELRDVGDWAIVRQALDVVLSVSASDYLEVTEGGAAVAAAAVLALKVKNFAATSSPEDIELIHALPLPPSDLIGLAVQSLERVASENSEIKELWDEVENKEWPAGIEALKAALQ